jgi:hypothetical protein
MYWLIKYNNIKYNESERIWEEVFTRYLKVFSKYSSRNTRRNKKNSNNFDEFQNFV